MGVVRARRWLLATCVVAACVGGCKPTTGSPGLEPPGVRSPSPSAVDAGSPQDVGFGNKGGGSAIGTGGTTSPAGAPAASASGGTGGSTGSGAAGAPAMAPSSEDDAGAVAH